MTSGERRRGTGLFPDRSGDFPGCVPKDVLMSSKRVSLPAPAQHTRIDVRKEKGGTRLDGLGVFLGGRAEGQRARGKKNDDEEKR